MNLFCDNKAAIDIPHDSVQLDKSHVEVDIYFIEENLESDIIDVPHVKTRDQLVDILKKVVPSKAFYRSLDKLDIRDIYASS